MKVFRPERTSSRTEEEAIALAARTSEIVTTLIALLEPDVCAWFVILVPHSDGKTEQLQCTGKGDVDLLVRVVQKVSETRASARWLTPCPENPEEPEAS